MRKIFVICFILVCTSAVLAQDSKQDIKPTAPARNDFGWARNPYRLDFVVKELDNTRVINSRSYSIITQSAEERGRSFGEFKAGSRVPIVTTTKEGAQTTQYMDVGVNMSAQLYILENSNLLMTFLAEISSLAETPAGQNPIVRQMRANTTGEIVAGRSNMIVSVDDPVSNHRFEIDVTPTKLR